MEITKIKVVEIEPEFLTLKQVCQKINLSKSTILRYIKKDYLSPIPRGNGKKLFDKDEVNSFINKLKNGQTSKVS